MPNKSLMVGYIKQCTTCVISYPDSKNEQTVSLEILLQDTYQDLHRLRLTMLKLNTESLMDYPNNFHDIQTALINQVPICLVGLDADGVLFRSLDGSEHDITFLTEDWSFV